MLYPDLSFSPKVGRRRITRAAGVSADGADRNDLFRDGGEISRRFPRVRTD